VRWYSTVSSCEGALEQTLNSKIHGCKVTLIARARPHTNNLGYRLPREKIGRAPIEDDVRSPAGGSCLASPGCRVFAGASESGIVRSRGSLTHALSEQEIAG
jgi:hypothetical protein